MALGFVAPVLKLGDKELKEWREKDLEMQKNEEKEEEKIRMLKKERNRVRAGPQRRAPNPKRQKMDEDAEISGETQAARNSRSRTRDAPKFRKG